MQTWPGDGARGDVVIVHGLGEHLGRYGYLAEWLSTRGFRCTLYDQRGHGESEGRRGTVPRSGRLVDDLAEIVDAVREPGRRLGLAGTSMGGAVVAGWLAGGRRPADFALLMSPAFGAPLTLVQRLQLTLGRKLFPDLALANGLDTSGIAHDPATVQAYLDDPLVHDRISARLADDILRTGAMAVAAASNWTTPTLLLYSGADRLVDPAGSDAFAARAPRDVVEAARFDELYHDVLREGPLAAPAFARIERWLDARLPR